MELCADGHEEICFETRYCPLCDAQVKIEELGITIGDLEDKITELEEK